MKTLVTLAEAKQLIDAGRSLQIAGDEALLRALPRGNWIGGTTPYLMGEGGGLKSRAHLLVTEVPAFAARVEIESLEERQLAGLYGRIPEHGYSVLIMPVFGRAELSFAMNAPRYEGYATRALVGWISGVDLDDFGKVKPLVFNGRTGAVDDQDAVVMHVTLPETKGVEIGIINVFEHDAGDVLSFPEPGFVAREVLVNGQPRNFHDYIREKGWDLRWPMVGEYCGASINVGMKGLDAAKRQVDLWAPVFPGIEYRHAAPLGDYVRDFLAQVPSVQGTPAFSCNCLTNYLFGELEGKCTGEFRGPVVFGEIAYQLVNQTMVYLSVRDRPRK